MGRPISLFSDFHKEENRITNYCGLILKMLYGEDPAAFQDAIDSLLEDSAEFSVLPEFEQQERKKSDSANSVPDLIIRQKSFNIYFEVKTSDWFYEDQIERHLANLKDEQSGADSKILFLLTDEFDPATERLLEKNAASAKANGVMLKAVTFEGFLASVKEATEKYIGKGSYINTVLPEFERFLDEQGLLSSWRRKLDITACIGSKDEIDLGIYVCPATQGRYNHSRARFFGAYWEKSIRRICVISGIVIAESKDGRVIYSVQWNNTFRAKTDAELIVEAEKRFRGTAQFSEVETEARRIFILDEAVETDIIKASDGGLYSRKMLEVNSNTPAEVAKELDGWTW